MNPRPPAENGESKRPQKSWGGSAFAALLVALLALFVVAFAHYLGLEVSPFPATSFIAASFVAALVIERRLPNPSFGCAYAAITLIAVAMIGALVAVLVRSFLG